MSYILWTKLNQKVPFGKVCLAYSDFASVQIVYITKNVKKLGFGRMNIAL